MKKQTYIVVGVASALLLIAVLIIVFVGGDDNKKTPAAPSTAVTWQVTLGTTAQGTTTTVTCKGKAGTATNLLPQAANAADKACAALSVNAAKIRQSPSTCKRAQQQIMKIVVNKQQYAICQTKKDQQFAFHNVQQAFIAGQRFTVKTVEPPPAPNDAPTVVQKKVDPKLQPVDPRPNKYQIYPCPRSKKKLPYSCTETVPVTK